MPVMDGYEFVKQLRLDPTSHAIPVVFCTAHYSEREARALALSTGVSHVLTKPAEAEEVLQIVDRILRGEFQSATVSEPPVAADFDRDHLRLLTDKLSESVEHERNANARLRALINIGLELASQPDANQLFESVCSAARELFGASYVTLGIVDRRDRTVSRLVTCGADRGSMVQIGNGVPGILDSVVSERRTIRGDNPGGDPLALQLGPEHPSVGAFLAAPVAAPDHVYGWIFLVGNEGRTFTEEDEQLVQALAAHVGRIYENGYFYREATRERDRARQYLDAAEVILLALDMDGRITLVNRYACALLGWSADELRGRDFIETCIPARIRDMVRHKLHTVHGGDDSTMVNAILTRSGDERLIEWRNCFLRDEDGRVVGTLSSGTDVTERTAAEAQVRLQSAALDATAAAMVISDADGVIEWVNPAFCALTGYSVDEAVGKNPRDLVKSGHHDQAFYKDLWDTILSGQVWRGEMINRRKDHSLFMEEQTITPVRDSLGEVGHFIDVGQDITERKRIEAEFRERTQLSALMAAVGLGLADSETLEDALQRCAEAFVNHLGAAFARIWTLDPKQGVLELQASAGLYTHLNGAHSRIPIGQCKVGRVARDRKPLLTNGLIGDPELGDQQWAHSERMVAFAGYPLVADGRVVGVMGLFATHPLSPFTISALGSVAGHVGLRIEQHRNAMALRATEERMRFIVENADVGIWDLDYTTGALRWSERMQAHYGLRPENVGGSFETFMERVHPDDRDSVRETVENARKAGTEFTTQHRAVLPDGSVRWLSGAGRVLLGVHGEPVRAVGLSLDITKHRTLEDQFHQAQKMEAVGRLAAGVAHDFNNLLTAILGYCELLLEDFGPTDPRAGDILEIQKAGTRAARLTLQLLAFSRKQIIEPALIDLNVIVADMRGMLERLIGEDVQIVVKLPPDLCAVRADRSQIEQIVMNLAVNGRDAMPKGGTLTIETANVVLDEHYAMTHLDVKAGPYVVLTVSDTGTGMTPEVQARLFEPFFTTKEPGKGTGLGMATVYGIVAQSGGTVAVYSEVGRGTSFKVYFPRADSPHTVTTPAAIARTRSGTQTVLVVEDADGLRELAKRLLERQGYTVLIAANAEEAMQVFEQSPVVDILLTDVVMPGASGPELTERLVAQRPSLKVIYMSGYTEDGIIQHGVLRPGIAFLHKPFTSDTLGRKIREVLDS
jgi:PAS domain S-box-containing protein